MTSSIMWRDHGFILRNDLISEHVAKNLSSWINQISKMPEQVGALEHHWEQTNEGPKLCRTEHFLEQKKELYTLITQGPIQQATTELLGEQAILYKEKINYKLPGGAGKPTKCRTILACFSQLLCHTEAR